MGLQNLIRFAAGRRFIEKSDAVLRFVAARRGPGWQPFSGFAMEERRVVRGGWGVMLFAALTQAAAILYGHFYLIPVTALGAALTFFILAAGRRAVALRRIEAAHRAVLSPDEDISQKSDRVEALAVSAVGNAVAALLLGFQGAVFLAVFALTYSFLR